MANSVHEFEAVTNSGETVQLDEYKGKVLLIVNTASRCGFTPQYEQLQELYERNQEKLEVLAFPCNQFGSQEPGTAEDIREFCDTRFNVTFPLFAKVDVNGNNSHPLFAYLKTELPGLLGSTKIKWNFTKFLVDAEGKPVKRYAPQTKPNSIEKDIKKLLG
ncbi:MAG: glutathione peroxidase [Deltaproteobacteria bacterium]|nr:MAG: glutathione peroxidase [Deltaproteobacteria bacterium]